MSIWQNLAIAYRHNPNLVPDYLKSAMKQKYEYDITHPKKKNSFGDKLKGVAKGLLTGNMIGLATGLVTNPKKTIQSVGSMVTGKTAGAASSGAALGATSLSTSMLPEAKKKTGLLTQLRKPKGNIGGGSYTETVKNPLGGSAGKTGR